MKVSTFFQSLSRQIRLSSVLSRALQRAREHWDDTRFVACSDCFRNQGLRLDATQLGVKNNGICQNCHSRRGKKLNSRVLSELAYRFFHWGTMIRFEYGAAPYIVFNNHRKTDIDPPLPWLRSDMMLFENLLDVGF